MLNIPESVKTLFKTDGTHKNFRVQFPNGEFPDITNENIVRESVHFTESLCSQSVFKFGLAEASVLEFETVGIGNMYGMTINASIEIDLSSLTASEIADIEAGTWDGEFVNLSSSDLGFPFFRVPLGVFRVEKCPRNHGAMAHRQVEAYSAGGVDLTSPFETAKLRSPGTYKAKYTPNVHRLVYASLGLTNPEAMSGFTKTVVDTWGNFPIETAQKSRLGNAVAPLITYELTATTDYRALNFGSGLNADKLYQLEVTTDFATVSETVSQFLDTVSDMAELTKTRFLTLTKSASVIKAAREVSFSSDYDESKSVYFTTSESIPVFYPLYSGSYCVYVPESVTVKITKRDASHGTIVVGTIFEQTFSDLVTDANLYVFTDNFSNLKLSLGPTAGLTLSGVSYSTYIDAYSLEDLIQSYFEVSAEFGKSDRSGGLEIMRLDQSSPTAIGPGDLDDCWWDEYDVDPIGTVTVAYKDNKNSEQIVDVSIGSGASVYDMTQNELLEKIANATLTSIKSIITTDFAPYARAVEYTPIEMTMQGWPWMEAGDALRITAEDGTVVKTYALRVEMSGIQHLMSSITAEGGEIVGET